MSASEEAANRQREESAEAGGETIVGVERYEVGLFEVPSAGPVSGVTDTVGGFTDPVRGHRQVVRRRREAALGKGGHSVLTRKEARAGTDNNPALPLALILTEF